MNIKSYISEHFPKSDLSPVGSYISSENHLRFELGDGLENGTEARVNQCLLRATQIFEEHFKPNDTVDILIKTSEYAEGTRELYLPNKEYFEKQIKGFNGLNIIKEIDTIEEFDEALNENDVMEMTDFTTIHIQRIVSQNLDNIEYKNIFKALINLEMGFEPSISERVYFINRRNNVAFHIYDDRGCLLFSDRKETLKPTYIKFNSWLVDYHRPTFDQLFV